MIILKPGTLPSPTGITVGRRRQFYASVLLETREFFKKQMLSYAAVL
jgi:hypothetical protein